MSTNWDFIKHIISAEQLCRFADISRAKDEKKRNEKENTSENLLDEQKKLFFQSEFLEYEFEALLLKALGAAKQGKHEIEVMKFSAAYCTDGGRAINNSGEDWKETLQGKAMSFYTIWKEHGQPNGYRLKAKINGYPGGFIGDISIFIDWS